MSAKSKTAMETLEGDAKGYVRPSRNLPPVSYVERKRTTKDSSAEPIDEKKKKVNGSATTKKTTGKKKAATDDVTSEPHLNGADDEPMPESRKPTEKSKAKAPVDDVTDKKVPKDSKATSRKKAANDAVEKTNGESSSLPIESKSAAPSKATKGKKATQPTVTADDPEVAEEEVVATKPKAVKGKKATQPPVTAENAEAEEKNGNQDRPAVSKAVKGKKDGDEVPTKPVASKPAASKTVKGKKVVQPPVTSDDPEVEKNGNQDEPATSKVVKGKKAVQPPVTTDDAEVPDDEVPTKPAAASQTVKGKKVVQAPVTADDAQRSKAVKGKKVVQPPVVSESNGTDEDNEAAVESNTKTKSNRQKKPATAKDQQRGTKRKLEPPAVTIIQPKIVKRRVTSTSTLQTPIVSEDFYVPSSPFTLKISSWNVAGLRALVKKDGMKFFLQENPDIFCLQETKCLEEEVPEEANIAGYHKYWHGFKGGHAGVAMYSKIMPYDVTYGINEPQLDQEARTITAEFTKFYVLCVYVPNSGRKLVNLAKRLDWDSKFLNYVQKLNQKKPVIICGDMNVAHEEIDLANPKTNKKSAGFTIDERNGMTKMLDQGFVDTFRALYPNKTSAYTFWTYMANARSKNVGWRLDYFIVSERLQGNIVDNVIRSSVLGSDHCPLTLFLNF